MPCPECSDACRPPGRPDRVSPQPAPRAGACARLRRGSGRVMMMHAADLEEHGGLSQRGGVVEEDEEGAAVARHALAEPRGVEVAQERGPHEAVPDARHAADPHTHEGNLARARLGLAEEEQAARLVQRHEAGAECVVRRRAVVKRLGELRGDDLRPRDRGARG